MSKSEAEMEGLCISSVNVIFFFFFQPLALDLFCFLLLLFVSYLAKFHLNENVPGERNKRGGKKNCFHISAGTKWKGIHIIWLVDSD
jgi:hypothetical protein